MFKIPYRSILKIYRISLVSVLPYSLSLAMLYILIEPKTKPTFSDTTDWMALCLFVIGLFAVCLLHACIVYQVINSVNRYAASGPTDGKNLIDEIDEDRQKNLFEVLGFGLRKMIPVFTMGICYLILVAIGLVALIVPGIFLFFVGSMSLFIIALKDTNPKDAFIESYHMIAPHWLLVAKTMVSLAFLFYIIEIIAGWIFTEQVVFDTLFSVLIRGFLWPIAYVTMITLYSEFSNAQVIVDSQDLKPLRQNRKQKFRHIAPNQ